MQSDWSAKRTCSELASAVEWMATVSTPSSRAARDRKSTRLNPSHGYISYAVFCLERKSTRLNSSHGYISYAVFCLKKKTGVGLLRRAVDLTVTRSTHLSDASDQFVRRYVVCGVLR